MEDYKEFQGKSLDEAIHNACVYYDTPREKLEIDIVEDAKSGLFGIVGVRKATIRARRVSLKGSVGSILNREGGPAPLTSGAQPEKIVKKNTRATGTNGGERRPDVPAAPKANAPATPKTAAPAASKTEPRIEATPAASPVLPHAAVPPTLPFGAAGEGKKPAGPDATSAVPAAPRPARPEWDETRPRYDKKRGIPPVCHELEDSGAEPGERHVPFEELDPARLAALADEAAKRLVTPILGEVPVTVEIAAGHVNVNVDCGENSGLLIGREGQTLSSLQYLASRIVSAGMGAAVRVQFNVGDYRERQDERLRELALVLAERVRATGRACSTRPMSSYHRRIIHLTLQDTPDVQTRSSGEGPMKRIIVQKKKNA